MGGGQTKKENSKEKNEKKVKAIVSYLKKKQNGGTEGAPKTEKLSQVRKIISLFNSYNIAAVDIVVQWDIVVGLTGL